MKVTIYLNEARGSMSDGFDKAAAQLVEGFEFDNGRAPVSGGGQATDDAITHALDEIYVLANVGGDLYPHSEWSAEYRRQGHRSLSKGDVVVIDGYGFFAVGPVVGQDEEHGGDFAGFVEIAGGEHWVTKALALAVVSGENADHVARKAAHLARVA